MEKLARHLGRFARHPVRFTSQLKRWHVEVCFLKPGGFLKTPVVASRGLLLKKTCGEVPLGEKML